MVLEPGANTYLLPLADLLGARKTMLLTEEPIQNLKPALAASYCLALCFTSRSAICRTLPSRASEKLSPKGSAFSLTQLNKGHAGTGLEQTVCSTT